MKQQIFKLLVVMTITAPSVSSRGQGQTSSAGGDVIAIENNLRDTMRGLLQKGVDLSTAQAREQFFYEPALSALPPGLRPAVKQYLSTKDEMIGEAANQGTYDVADRLFEGLADSVKISNTQGGSLNADLSNQAEVARKNMCKSNPDACASVLEGRDVASLDLSKYAYVCALVGRSENDILCNPKLRYTLYCSYGQPRAVGVIGNSDGAMEVSCNGRTIEKIVGAWNKFPPHFSRHVRTVNGQKTLEGLPFPKPCQPPPSERCSPVDDFFKGIFRH